MSNLDLAPTLISQLHVELPENSDAELCKRHETYQKRVARWQEEEAKLGEISPEDLLLDASVEELAVAKREETATGFTLTRELYRLHLEAADIVDALLPPARAAIADAEGKLAAVEKKLRTTLAKQGIKPESSTPGGRAGNLNAAAIQFRHQYILNSEPFLEVKAAVDDAKANVEQLRAQAQRHREAGEGILPVLKRIFNQL